MIETYKKIFSLLDKKEKRNFLLLMLMIIIMSLLDVIGVAAIIPFLAVLSDPEVIQDRALLAFIYDTVPHSGKDNFLFILGLAVLILVSISLAFKALTMYSLVRFSTMRNYSISSRLLENYLSQPYSWFLSRNSADMGKSILSEVDQVIQASVIPAVTLLAHLAVVAALTSLLFYLEPLVMVTAVGLIGGSYILVFLGIRGLLSRIGEERVKANGKRFQCANEAIGGIKEVKLLGLETEYIRRFKQPAHVFARTQAIGTIIGQLPRYILELVAFGGMLLLLLFLLTRSQGRIEDLVPVIGVFAFAGVRMFPAIQQVYLSFTKIRFGRYALDALHRDLAKSSPVTFSKKATQPLKLDRTLELRGINFCFPGADRNAINDLDLKIPAKSITGIVGGSGAGKTTLIDIILGLLIPQTGDLFVDDSRIDDANRTSWQRGLGYVPQYIFLVDASIASNVAFGIPNSQVDLAAVERACKLAELHTFIIDELPKGYDTIVGERGIRLSGGQRQRIGIARALYHNPDVLVLDEATSALDNVTESTVIDAVQNLTGEKTIIVVAHRLSTIRNCDQIAILSEGHVKALGTYDVLLETSPEFRQLAEAGGNT